MAPMVLQKLNRQTAETRNSLAKEAATFLTPFTLKSMHPRVEEAAALVHLNNQYVSEKKARRAAISSLRCQEKFFPGKWSTAGQSRNWAIGNIANSLVEALIASRQLTIRPLKSVSTRATVQKLQHHTLAGNTTTALFAVAAPQATPKPPVFTMPSNKMVDLDEGEIISLENDTVIRPFLPAIPKPLVTSTNVSSSCTATTSFHGLVIVYSQEELLVHVAGIPVRVAVTDQYVSMIALVDYRPEGSKFGKDFRMADVRQASRAEAGKSKMMHPNECRRLATAWELGNVLDVLNDIVAENQSRPYTDRFRCDICDDIIKGRGTGAVSRIIAHARSHDISDLIYATCPCGLICFNEQSFMAHAPCCRKSHTRNVRALRGPQDHR